MNLHRPVMLDEAVAGLAVRDAGIYVDGTFGRGGHSAAILERLGAQGHLHALDQDPQAVAHARERFGDEPRLTIHHRNFAELAQAAAAIGVAGQIDGVLMDLGVSSPQLDDAGRGFSFSKDGPLDMRMNPQAGESAADWLARAEEAEIADVIWRYGDERNSRRIARRIVETRAAAPLTTTAQLANLIAGVPGPRSHHIHPATRSFQAIRIHVNRELDVLAEGLQQAVSVLKPGGRLVVIAFHSLEDRIVKRYLRDSARSETPTLKLHGKQFPTREEASANPRARSAVLRIAERLP
ncbi:16S rRNA (cytosine(1402)-N(4))-methyltransferase RsmH [Solimonas terrae]|uniref:Ribosomal RNA small subunit methyltransferase H n=1 Tax=Solimonas terrae TaxID=1396819 RepID=A0A6M2BUK4_9GAMM|nr:16S rRNA (cytosine(1402)-N(4))-methyltransferase RsmH [Solimonas terrae]NGY05803.1 16S rRNA (cytosine(1402)-N(4))-methyltransferase RsmH [Solimonas terrae]